MRTRSARTSEIASFKTRTQGIEDGKTVIRPLRVGDNPFMPYADRRRRSAGGEPKRLLVDFLVGAHASLRTDRLITLDPDRYRTHFPDLELVGL